MGFIEPVFSSLSSQPGIFGIARGSRYHSLFKEIAPSTRLTLTESVTASTFSSSNAIYVVEGAR